MHLSHIDPGPDTIRVLITTDNHVGYNENDSIRSDDSWKTFQEITYLAKNHDVDMILQGGDLFHINKPLKKSMYHVMRSLRLNTMGDKPCELELLSDPAKSLGGHGFDTVNYEDPNLNISIPMFAISGNHDDATGEGLLLPMDLLQVAGLVNHFGRVTNVDSITVSPLLFQKGNTKLSLYGLASVRDERMFKTFASGKVTFQRANTHKDDWFNLMMVHQNHAAHTDTSYLPELFLPLFLDMVIWGHEHECIPYPVHNLAQSFEVLQAGLLIATLLCEGEAKEKCVFIMNIKARDYSLETIPLKTVRPFEMEEISLLKLGFPPGPSLKADIEAYLTERIEQLIENATSHYKKSNHELYEDGDDNVPPIPLPLIRLRVEYSGGFEVTNPRRFSNKFVGKVANVNDVVQFYKKREKKSSDGNTVKYADAEEDGKTESAEIKVQQLMGEFLAQTELSLLPEEGINNAVAAYLNQDDKTILKKYIDKELSLETKMLLKVNLNSESEAKDAVKNVLKQIKQERKLKSQVELGDKPESLLIGDLEGNKEGDVDEEDEDEIEILKPSSYTSNSRSPDLDQELADLSPESIPKTKAKRRSPKKSKEVISLEEIMSSEVILSLEEEKEEEQVITSRQPSSRRIGTRRTPIRNTKPITEVEIHSDSESDEYVEEPKKKHPIRKKAATNKPRGVTKENKSKPSKAKSASRAKSSKDKDQSQAAGGRDILEDLLNI